MSKKDLPPPSDEAKAASALLTADYLLVVTDDGFAKADPSNPIASYPALPNPVLIKTKPDAFVGAVGQRYNALIEANPHKAYRHILAWFNTLFCMPGNDRRTVLQGKPLDKDKDQKGKNKAKPKQPVLSQTAQIMAKQLFPAKRRIMKSNRDKTEYEKPSVPALVYTSSLDCLFEKAGFPTRNLCCVDGDIIHWQCSHPCSPLKFELHPMYRFVVGPDGLGQRLIAHDEVLRQLLQNANPAQLVDAKSADSDSVLKICTFCNENNWKLPMALPPLLPEPPLPPSDLAELDHRLFSYPGVMEPKPPHPADIGEEITRHSAVGLSIDVPAEYDPFSYTPRTPLSPYSNIYRQNSATNRPTESLISPTTIRRPTSFLTPATNTLAISCSGTSALTSPTRPQPAPLRQSTSTAEQTFRLRHTIGSPTAFDTQPDDNDEFGGGPMSATNRMPFTTTTTRTVPFTPSSHVSVSRSGKAEALFPLVAPGSNILHSDQLPTASQFTARRTILSDLSIVKPADLIQTPFRTVSDYAPPPISPTYASLSPRNTQPFDAEHSVNPLSQRPDQLSPIGTRGGQFSQLSLTSGDGTVLQSTQFAEQPQTPPATHSLARLVTVPRGGLKSGGATNRSHASQDRPSTSSSAFNGAGGMSATEIVDSSVRQEYLGSSRLAAFDSELYSLRVPQTESKLVSGKPKFTAKQKVEDTPAPKAKATAKGKAKGQAVPPPPAKPKQKSKEELEKEKEPKPLLPLHPNLPRCPRCSRDCRPACRMVTSDRTWVGGKAELGKFSTWMEAITHELEKDPNLSIVFLELGVKQTAKIHTQLMQFWKAQSPSVTIIRVGGGKVGQPAKKKANAGGQQTDEEMTQIEVYHPLSLFSAIMSIDQQMREIVGEFEFQELMFPSV
ncbi:hypothetical protein BLNAU_633 [Blattamonas nauphoetae]|uniref:Uncharacterized protein n=1 Tax=Blattamonas nauphoetae TaxID=2049346 RepID=A0ABQ9YK25_9EUKA|nr:hypothetical protein BLNAU_633 [Blattamonas nauphoetae]